MDASHIELGRIVNVTGSGASARLFKDRPIEESEEAALTIGKLVGIRSDDSLIVGVVVRVHVQPPEADEKAEEDAGDLVADIDFMGEIRRYHTEQAFFQRGVSNYPMIRDRISRLHSDDISLIHRIDAGETVARHGATRTADLHKGE